MKKFDCQINLSFVSEFPETMIRERIDRAIQDMQDTLQSSRICQIRGMGVSVEEDKTTGH